MNLFTVLKMSDRHVRLTAEGKREFWAVSSWSGSFFPYVFSSLELKEYYFKSLSMYDTTFSHTKLNFFHESVLGIFLTVKMLVVAAQRREKFWLLYKNFNL
jgi:hypothetical protein